MAWLAGLYRTLAVRQGRLHVAQTEYPRRSLPATATFPSRALQFEQAHQLAVEHEPDSERQCTQARIRVDLGLSARSGPAVDLSGSLMRVPSIF